MIRITIEISEGDEKTHLNVSRDTPPGSGGDAEEKLGDRIVQAIKSVIPQMRLEAQLETDPMPNN